MTDFEKFWENWMRHNYSPEAVELAQSLYRGAWKEYHQDLENGRKAEDYNPKELKRRMRDQESILHDCRHYLEVAYMEKLSAEGLSLVDCLESDGFTAFLLGEEEGEA